MLRALEEVRFLASQSWWPIVVYTDVVALVSILRKDDTRGRIAEYNFEPRHAKIKDMAIADGMARMPYQGQDKAWTGPVITLRVQHGLQIQYNTIQYQELGRCENGERGEEGSGDS